MVDLDVLLDNFKPKEFLRLLNVGNDLLSKAPDFSFTRKTFLTQANAIAQSVNKTHFADKPLLLFKATGHQPPLGHVTDSKCTPNIIAAFDTHWVDDKTAPWPLIQLVGEIATKAETMEEREKRAKTYLHYLLLARPDLRVAQGIFITAKRVRFLLGIEGTGIAMLNVGLDSKNLGKLLFAFIYRIYSPECFADPSYVGVEPDLCNNSVKYTIRITVQPTNRDDGAKGHTIDCPGYSPLYASNPFKSRTHVLHNPSSQVKVNDQVFPVIKDQLCDSGTHVNETTILSRIHEQGTVPGVVEMVHSETIETPLSEGLEKNRLGLRQSGGPFMDIQTPRKMLETLFDVLEVLRYLRLKRNVLHRDISRGNVLYIEQPSPMRSQSVVAKDTEDICFIKCLLGESNDAHETSALLIDFDRGEDLERNDYEAKRTGTPIFVARAVELQGPVPLPENRVPVVSAVPQCPESYSSKHPERFDKFPFGKRKLLQLDVSGSSNEQVDKSSLAEEILIRKPADGYSEEWRHGLEHDAESVFWLLAYWAMVAQPERSGTRSGKEAISLADWGLLLGKPMDRDCLLMFRFSDWTHSFYNPLSSLIKSLANILLVDSHWLERSDMRNQPEYVSEAFQRLILQFILDNRDQAFMNQPIDKRLRTVYGEKSATQSDTSLQASRTQRDTSLQSSQTQSNTSLQASSLPEIRKRSSSLPSKEEDSSKRRRLDAKD